MDAKFVAFLVACMIALWFLGRSDDPQIDQERTASPTEKVGTEKDSILDGLYQLEG